MAEVQSFMMDNVMLVSILSCLLLGYAIFEVFMNQVPGIVEVSPQKAIDLFNHEHAVLLDIRPLADFNSAHCVGAISVHANGARIEQFKNKPVIVICNSGRTSLTYAKELSAKGFTQALSLAGGIIAWKNSDFPVVQPLLK